MRRKKIVATGFMGQCPIAGVVWQHLHYIIGLQRLGHEVYYVEDTMRQTYNPTTLEWSYENNYHLKFLSDLAKEYGFAGRWCFRNRYLPGQPCAGLAKTRLLALYRDADAILCICGWQELNDDIPKDRCLLYLESDPAVEQIKIDNGGPSLIEELRRYHKLFTFGENIGTNRFPVPLHGVQWLPTRQPVVTDLWHTPPPRDHPVFTSIANWSTAGRKDIEWRGERYLWSKSLEFLKFVEAPAKSGEAFELATTISEPRTAARFAANNWRLTSPRELSVNIDDYRSYIQRSKGEFTAAKDQYVRLNTGWFSDRSACYLASGRPVITQETGFSSRIPSGRGLFAFQTLEEITEAVREINADYPAHCRAAFEVAAEYFEATKVLASLLDRAGI